jgi:hypothetical protein
MKTKILKRLSIVATIAIIIFALLFMTNCSSCDRCAKDIGSDLSGGLNRIINIYDLNGNIIITYEGKIDLEPNDSGVVKFELDGKRYMYYNAFVEVIEK